MRETGPLGQTMAMILLFFGIATALYLLLWPFSLRLDARLSPTSGRGELLVASLIRLRLEGDFLQPPFFRLYKLDGRGGRKRMRVRRRRKGGFVPIVRISRLDADLYVGLETDGALTVEALGMLCALTEALGRSFFATVVLRPGACFDKTICSLRLSGIGRFILAQNIVEYLKGKKNHAKR